MDIIILSRRELNKSLKDYQSLFDMKIIDYLYNLVSLDISALNQNAISDELMQKLNELKIYRKIVLYNIYNKIIDCSKDYGEYFNILINKDGISINCKDKLEKEYGVFNYKINEIGKSNIILNQIINNPKMRKEQIDLLYQELDKIKAISETPETLLIVSKQRKIKDIKTLIKELENRSNYEENIEYISEIQKPLFNSLLGNDGLQIKDDFKEDTTYLEEESNLSNNIERALTKKLVKEYPHTTITKNIRYY